MKIFRDFSYHLLPPSCLLCRAPGQPQRDICADCERDLPWLQRHCLRCAMPMSGEGDCGACLQTPPAFQRCIAAWEYGFPLDQLITGFKHHGRLSDGALLAELWLQSRGQGIDPLPERLLPVPLHWRRRLRRGFNQAELLAQQWGRALNIELSQAITRRKATAAQQQLSARERRRNLRNAFTAPNPATIEGRHLAIVDDVITTGATADALAKLLLNAGARQVDIWCLARTA